jgi:protein-S-isoprenylcysteine O-methyltransferase Ste14
MLRPTTIVPDKTAEVVFAVVTVCWLSFGGILVVGRRGATRSSTRRDWRSLLGFLLQGVAYFICFAFYRPYFSPFLPMPKVSEQLLGAIAIAIALGSVWFCYQAARTLGKQWALVARVIEGHEPIIQGPYAIVRNPIYLAMLGMLLAMALAVSKWETLLAALVVFAAGTAIRIRTEESLLRGAFGVAFAEYARRVPAFFPRVL